MPKSRVQAPLRGAILPLAALLPLLAVAPAAVAASVQKPPPQTAWLERSVAAALKAGAGGRRESRALDTGAATIRFVNHLLSDELANPPAWLRRTAFQWNVSDPQHARLELMTLQPLAALAGGTLVTQDRFSYVGHEIDPRSIAVGYRRLSGDDRVLLGVGSRFQTPTVGAGARSTLRTELRSSPFELTSSWKRTAPQDGAEAGSRRGRRYDLRSRLSLPYTSYARLKARYTDTRAVDGTSWQSRRYGLWLSPLQHLDLEAHYQDSSIATDDWGISLRFTMKLNDPHAAPRGPFFSARPYAMASMRDHQLDPLY